MVAHATNNVTGWACGTGSFGVVGGLGAGTVISAIDFRTKTSPSVPEKITGPGEGPGPVWDRGFQCF